MDKLLTELKSTLPHRLRQALALWGLLRYESRLFRWSPIAEPASGAAAVRWLGNARIGGRNFHALSCAGGSEAVYKLLAPPFSRIVAWCALLPNGDIRTASEFTIVVRRGGPAQDLTRTVQLKPGRSAGRRRWRKLVLEIRNTETEQVEVRLATRRMGNADASPDPAVWGEPRLEWPRPGAEIKELIRFVSRPALRGQLVRAARLLHRRLSSSTNPAVYQVWLSRQLPSPDDLARMRRESDRFAYRPLISVVTPVYNTDAQWLRACIESVRRQAYPRWQLCLADDGSTRAETQRVLQEYQNDPRILIQRLQKNAGISVASNAALAMVEGEFVALLDHDDEITPDALFEIVARLNDDPDADLLYSDEDKLEIDGSFSGPYFKPAWSPEHFLTNMYTCHLMVVRRTLVDAVGGFRVGYEGAQDYDLVLRLIERTTRIRHVPKVLYHWRKIPESTAGTEGAKPWAHDAGRLALEDYVRRNCLDAEILPGAYPYVYRPRFRVRGEPLVSIIPSIRAAPHSAEPEAAAERAMSSLLERTRYRHVEVVGSADGAAGEHLLFLESGLRALDEDWLTALLEYSQQEPIGAVGGKILYADGSLKHIGLLLGVNGCVAPAFHRHPQSSLGYWGSAIAVRNYSAVSAACMMTRRAVFERAGGFRAEFGPFADVDYCLRLTDAGYRVVFTPHAVVMAVAGSEWVESTQTGEHAARLRAVWRERLARDPYYNPNLSRESPDYEPDLSFAVPTSSAVKEIGTPRAATRG